MKKTKKVIRLKKEVKKNIIKGIIILLVTIILIHSLKNNDAQSLNIYRYNISMIVSYFIIVGTILLIPTKKGGLKNGR